MQLGFSSPIHLVESNLDGTFFEKLKKDIYSLRKNDVVQIFQIIWAGIPHQIFF